jgi:hypothetical protein
MIGLADGLGRMALGNSSDLALHVGVRCVTCLKAPRKSSGFFVPLLLHTAIADTLQATGAEDKPLRGRKLSADSGAKTRLGFGEPLSPSGGIESLGLASTRKIPGG